MGVRGSGESVDAIFRRRPDSHPFAIPPVPGGQGVWLIRRTPTPIGYVLKRPERGTFVYDVYAHCRNEYGKRLWLKAFQTFNSAVAWACQHERAIAAVIAENEPEPEAWPR
ncbi:hypothetical protein [Frondihabitans australicus]|uniref:hypothetical protein n=1 Tax=Frondihabitans australicus TaxID=386892 RepID=UPI0011C499D5|nr:hypothetical protein [Frondihabitans australicus]